MKHHMSGYEWAQKSHQFDQPEDSLQDDEIPDIWTALTQSHVRWKTGIHTKNAMDAYLAILLLRYSLFIIPILILIIWIVWRRVCDNINNWINHLTHVDSNGVNIVGMTSEEDTNFLRVQELPRV